MPSHFSSSSLLLPVQFHLKHPKTWLQLVVSWIIRVIVCSVSSKSDSGDVYCSQDREIPTWIHNISCICCSTTNFHTLCRRPPSWKGLMQKGFVSFDHLFLAWDFIVSAIGNNYCNYHCDHPVWFAFNGKSPFKTCLLNHKNVCIFLCQAAVSS